MLQIRPKSMQFRRVIIFYVVVAVALGSHGVNAGAVTPLSETSCQDCCDIAKSLGLQGDLDFDLEACRVQGCTGSQEPLQDTDCNVVTNNQEANDGCQIGRDFRFMGFTNRLSQPNVVLPTEFHQCLNGRLEVKEFDVGQVDLANEAISNTDCVSCINQLDEENDPQDDFARARAEFACNSGFFCFNEQHRQKLGCAIGINLRKTGQVILRERETFVCDAGNVVNVRDIVREQENDNDSAGAAVGITIAVVGVFALGAFAYRKRKMSNGQNLLDAFAPPSTGFPIPKQGGVPPSPKQSTGFQTPKQGSIPPSPKPSGHKKNRMHNGKGKGKRQKRKSIEISHHESHAEPSNLPIPEVEPLGPRNTRNSRFGYITSMASSWRTRLSLSSLLTVTVPNAPKARFPQRPNDYKSYGNKNKRNGMI